VGPCGGSARLAQLSKGGDPDQPERRPRLASVVPDERTGHVDCIACAKHEHSSLNAACAMARWHGKKSDSEVAFMVP